MKTCTYLLLVVTLIPGLSHGKDVSKVSPRPNVLFLVVDDLRPALGCYDDPVAISPNIDHLAERGVVFRRAYCQQAVCSPSRLSMLTGLRPDTIRVWDLKTHFREAVPDAVTLPQHFRHNGYHTVSIGKIFHGGGEPAKDPPSWSEPPRYDVTREPSLRYALPENLAGKGLKRASTESANVPDETYVDGLVCQEALQALQRLSKSNQPFFLAVGFRKPHLPFCAPQKYWDLYLRDAIPLPEPVGHPKDAPELAIRSWGELEGYTDVPNEGPLPTELVRRLRHGYYACVSYIDAQVGSLLDRLDELHLNENTIVVLWGDHGYHLGEQGLWTKANNFELSTRVPLIVAAPERTGNGCSTSALVELLDVYPTLAAACGLDIPENLEGTSLCPLLDNPDVPWKPMALSQYPRAYQGNRHRKNGDITGYALRTQRFRFVQWRENKTGKILAEELYDHDRDPHETVNLALQSGYTETMNRLRRQTHIVE